MGDKEIKRFDFSRRGFVGTVGLAMLAAGGSLIGCMNSEETDSAALADSGQELAWDYETDFVVCGAGTGMAAAVAAQANGASVVVLEKAAQVGGSTAISGGGVWCPCNPFAIEAGDTREKAERYLELLRQDQGSEELSLAFLDNASAMIELLADRANITWKASQSCDYHPEWEGAMTKCRAVSATPKEGQTPAMALVGHLQESIEAAGGTILTETSAVSLVTQQGDSGLQVIGVKAESGSNPIYVKANKGVLLSTGGYEWNDTWKNNFLRGLAPYNVSVSTNTGDGLRMAMSVGADLANMNECWGQVVWAKDSQTRKESGAPAVATTMDRQKPGRIFVNKHGKRFCNEAGDYDTLTRMFYTFEDWGNCEYANLPAYLITDEASMQKYSLGKATVGDAMVVSEENIVKADSLDELAALISVDAKNLNDTVNRFNEYAERGEDPDFHRGESLLDCTFMTDTTEGIIGTPYATLAALTTPPFYAIEIAGGCLGTCGGPKVNSNAQVLDTDGNPIKGLYASGNCAGIGAPGSSYGGPGGTIGPALTFAVIAGNHASLQ